jgi:hypothetical protein
MTNKSQSAQEMIIYDLGSSTEMPQKQKPEVFGPDKIEKEYGLAKPKRKMIKAKILSE